jgi:hypothetical protein
MRKRLRRQRVGSELGLKRKYNFIVFAKIAFLSLFCFVLFCENNSNPYKNSQFFLSTACILLLFRHIFAKIWAKKIFSCKFSEKTYIFANQFSRKISKKKVFFAKSANSSCHQIIFTKMVPLFHVCFVFSIIHLSNSHQLLISAKMSPRL